MLDRSAKRALAFCTLALIVVLGCTSSRAQEDHQGYVGDAACASCHLAQSRTYSSTAHHLTSQLPSSSSILGSFAAPSNVLSISDPPPNSDEPRLRFVMEQRPDGFYQTAVADLGPKHLTHGERIDVVFGSGVRGQTYLYWKGDQLSELPVSFWSDGHRWINSPGYKDGTANFSRHADPRCMECHVTYIHALSPIPDSYSYDRTTLAPGISCETCHGPGASHLAQTSAQRSAPGSKAQQTIINPARLSRDQQVDACALCHNGTAGKELRPAFSFRPGDKLADFIAPVPSSENEPPDVHGNQVSLLKRSRCFLNSPTMTCTTCHDVHSPERPAASYSTKCLGCHTWQSCGAAKMLGHSVADDCVSCHMPLQPTNAIVSATAGNIVRASIRTHWIRVYPGR